MSGRRGRASLSLIPPPLLFSFSKEEQEIEKRESIFLSLVPLEPLLELRLEPRSRQKPPELLRVGGAGELGPSGAHGGVVDLVYIYFFFYVFEKKAGSGLGVDKGLREAKERKLKKRIKCLRIFSPLLSLTFAREVLAAEVRVSDQSAELEELARVGSGEGGVGGGGGGRGDASVVGGGAVVVVFAGLVVAVCKGRARRRGPGELSVLRGDRGCRCRIILSSGSSGRLLLHLKREKKEGEDRFGRCRCCRRAEPSE